MKEENHHCHVLVLAVHLLLETSLGMNDLLEQLHTDTEIVESLPCLKVLKDILPVSNYVSVLYNAYYWTLFNMYFTNRMVEESTLIFSHS